jgi:hypothetical protein
VCFGDDCTFTISDLVNDDVGGNYGASMSALVWSECGIVFECPDWKPRPFHQFSFLSMRFKFDDENRQWCQVVNRDKLYSSLLQGGNLRDPPEMMQRLNSIRNVSWGDQDVRRELAILIDAYATYWDEALFDVPAWQEAKKGYLTDGDLENLFFGYH